MSTVQTTNIKHAASASNNITLDASGNVGVGTTPGAAAGYTFLTVLNNTTGSAVQTRSGSVDMRLQADAVGAGYAGTISFHPVIFWTNASERMRIDSFGRVGIGTSSPGVNLHVNGTGFVGVNVSGDSTSETQLRFLTNTAARISNQANTALLFDTNATERMRIDASGNVGIGTASPSDPLVLERSLAGGNGPFLRIRNSAGPNVATFGPALILDNGKAGVSPFILTQSQDTNAFRIAQANSPFATFMQLTTGGDLQFNSGYGSVATAFGCRAWALIEGSGTVFIRGSGNLSSVTDLGTGDYRLNYSTAMPNVNYAIVGSAGTGVGGNDEFNVTTNFNELPATTTTRIGVSRAASGTFTDAPYISIAVFR